MDFLSECVRASPRLCRTRYPPETGAVLSGYMRSLNNLLVSAALLGVDDSGAVPATDVERLVCTFMWTTRCCNPTSLVGDVYNATHLCGIVLCKYCFLYLRTYGSSCAAHGMQQFFAGDAKMHVAPGAVANMSYDNLALVLVGLQHEWSDLTATHPEDAMACLLACMARFGEFLFFSQEAKVLDEIDKREPVSENGVLFRATKKCTRAVVNTCLCLLRNFAMGASGRLLAVSAIDPATYKDLVYQAVLGRTATGKQALAPAILGCLSRIKSVAANIRNDMQVSDIGDVEVLWTFLVEKLGASRIGACPRKRDDALASFLQDIVLLIAQQTKAKDSDLCICSATMRVVRYALQYFYVVPSADQFRHLSLLETMSPGQRLNYAHDYCHFDTGQLSQVVYLHNPLFKATAPPNSVEEWKDESFAGPLAAFCQLLPSLQVWYEDSQDPLGVFDDEMHHSKPSDSITGGRHGFVMLHSHTRWILVLAQHRVLLVDRACSEVFSVPRPSHVIQEHHALGVLLLYLYKTDQIPIVATVAINGYKIRFDKSVDPRALG